jgi:uncharacterized protein
MLVSSNAAAATLNPMPATDWDYRAPWWLPGGNVQTIWSALWARRHAGTEPRFARERWATPDGDFVDVDFSASPAPSGHAPLLVLFHGLEGSSASQYAQAFATEAARRGWAFAVPHFRGCSGELNLAPRAYHSGDHEEIDWILRRLKNQDPQRPLLAVGISLGGNALLRWAAEQGHAAGQVVQAVSAVSSPIDLGAAGRAIDRGFNRHVYARMFLRSMQPKAVAKWRQFPGLFNLDAVLNARTLFDFDNAFTAPLHGFRDTPHYWEAASAKPRLHSIRVPALVLNAQNDPFVPIASLPPARQWPGGAVRLEQPAHGGHAGFVAASHGRDVRGHVLQMPHHVAGWLATAAGLGSVAEGP